MKADHMIQAQAIAVQTGSVRDHGSLNHYPAISAVGFESAPSAPSAPAYPVSSNPILAESLHMYPALVDLRDYMGLDLTTAERELLSRNDYAPALLGSREIAIPSGDGQLIAPLSGSSPGLRRAAITHGLREVILCKDKGGKIGLRARSLNKGIFIVLVSANSPAALAGLRFGDQILQINNESVAGFSMEKVHDILSKSPVNGIKLIVRDRPFERTITLHKDSTGHAGFAFKNGKITHLVKDSSAARNGLLIDHNLLEVNGQNVVGVDDKVILKIIDSGDDAITLTIMPSQIYDHLIKSMAPGLIKKLMDHSIPDV